MKRLLKGSWIDSYLEYNYNQESPSLFHQWTAMSIIGATLGRKVCINRLGKYTLYPNLFVILVAGSAKCKKSTSIGIGEKMLKKIENPPIIFAQKITPEALIQTLSESPNKEGSSGIIVADELSVFMGAEATKGGIIPLLTSLYDSKDEWAYRTRARGKEVLKNTTITILAGTTSDWLKASIPEHAIGGGFTSRIIFVFQSSPQRPILFHEETQRERELRQLLIHDLEVINKTMEGVFSFTSAAKKTATEWYEGEWSKKRDSKVDGYFARKHDTMFKVAAILSAAEKSDRIIHSHNISRALSMLEETEQHLDATIDSVATTSQAGSNMDKILQLVNKLGEITHTEFLRKCWRIGTAQELNLMIRTLIDAGEIKEVRTENGKTITYKRR